MATFDVSDRLARLPAELLFRPMDKLAHRAARLGLVAACGDGPARVRFAAGREVGGEKLRPQRAEQLAVEPAAVLEADFLLRGMHVDVDHLGRHVEPQKADWLPTREQEAAIRLAQRVLQRAVADRPAVEEQVLHPTRGAAVHRIGDVTGERDAVRLAGDFDQVVGDFLAEEGGNALPHVVHGRQVVYQPAIVREREVDVRMGERQASQRFGRVAHFGLRRAEEFVPHRGVEEQVPHFDRRANRAADRRDRPRLAADDLELGPTLCLGRAAAERESADLGDRGQRFAAETERADAEQVVGLADFAGGVAGHGERQLVGRDAAAVVRDADQLAAPLLYRDVDPAGAGVDRVL